MVRIRFLTRTVYDTNGPGLGPVYAAGEVAEVTLDVAERWLRRGKAEVVADEPASAPENTTAKILEAPDDEVQQHFAKPDDGILREALARDAAPPSETRPIGAGTTLAQPKTRRFGR